MSEEKAPETAKPDELSEVDFCKLEMLQAKTELIQTQANVQLQPLHAQRVAIYKKYDLNEGDRYDGVKITRAPKKAAPAPAAVPPAPAPEVATPPGN